MTFQCICIYIMWGERCSESVCNLEALPSTLNMSVSVSSRTFQATFQDGRAKTYSSPMSYSAASSSTATLARVAAIPNPNVPSSSSTSSNASLTGENRMNTVNCRRSENPIELYNTFMLANTTSQWRDALERLQSFEQQPWPHSADSSCSVPRMVENGYYFRKSPDTVRCFACSISLADWNVTTDCPKEAHATFSPLCPFSLSQRSSSELNNLHHIRQIVLLRLNIIQQVLKEVHEMYSQSQHMQQQQNGIYFTDFASLSPFLLNVLVYNASEEQIMAAACHTLCEKWSEKFKLPTSDVIATYHQASKWSFAALFPTRQSLTEKLIWMRQQSFLRRTSRDFEELMENIAYFLQNSSTPSEQTSTAIATDTEPTNKSLVPSTCSTNPAFPSTTPSQKPDPFLCGACRSARSSYILFPCRHISVCDECVKTPLNSTVCPRCLEEVCELRRVFFA